VCISGRRAAQRGKKTAGSEVGADGRSVMFTHVTTPYGEARAYLPGSPAVPETNVLSVTENLPDPPGSAGPVVVLVHGSLDRAASFTRVVRRLDDLHTVVYDRRGYQKSRNALPLNTTLDGHIDDLLTVIDGRPAVVIGHSYGGTIALGGARRDDSPIVSVAAYEPPMPWLDLWPKNAGARAAGDAETDEAAAERFFRRMVGAAAWERLSEEGKLDRRADGPALAAELRAIRLAEAPFDVSRLTVPAVFGRGGESVGRHRDSVGWLVEHTPGSELFEIHGALHGAHLTHPDGFASLVRRAVARAGRPAPADR
jgi:pimeloyl-ACP methyl ester carboxylesterase